MCILQRRSLLLAWGVVAASALAPALATAQDVSRPQTNPDGVGSKGDASGIGSYGGGMSASWYGGVQDGLYGDVSEAPSEGKSLSRVLTAAGVPNYCGRLQWPLGLRVVGGPVGDELRQQIEALFQYGAEQTQTGPVSSHLTEELARSVDALRKILFRHWEERSSLAETTYQAAERFLAKLDHARKLFEADPEPPGGKVR